MLLAHTVCVQCIVYVHVPYMVLHIGTALTITTFFFARNSLSSTLSHLVIPLLFVHRCRMGEKEEKRERDK